MLPDIHASDLGPAGAGSTGCPACARHDNVEYSAIYRLTAINYATALIALATLVKI